MSLPIWAYVLIGLGALVFGVALCLPGWLIVMSREMPHHLEDEL